MDEQLADQDDEELEAPLPWNTLDIPVAVPDTIPVAELLVIGQGQISEGSPGAPLSWVTVDVGPAAVGSGGPDHPEWTLSTRPRRGIRPTGPPHVDSLRLDSDVATIAADAVHRRLSLDIPSGLSAGERQLQVEQCWERSQQLLESFTILPSDTSPWERTVISVDGEEFAWWVYRDDGGWATADLGAVIVSAFGIGEAPSWSLTLLPPSVAVETLPVRS